MNKFIVLVSLLLSLSAVATAADMTSIDGVVCYPSKAVESWKYTSSGNTLNGVRDTQAYLQITFAPALVDGFYKQSTVSYKVAGLSWDKKFKQVIYTKKGAPVVCAKNSAFSGQRLYTNDCAFKAAFADATVDQMGVCGDDVRTASSFEGIFVVY